MLGQLGMCGICIQLIGHMHSHVCVKMVKEQLKRDHAEMEQEQLKRERARARKRKQRDTASEESKTKENESDRLRKKRCIQGESSGDR